MPPLGRAVGGVAVVCLAAAAGLAALAHGSTLFGWTLAAGLAVTVAVTAAVAAVLGSATRAWRARDVLRLDELDAALRRVETDARTAWRMLKDEHVIDGFALWDHDDRLADFSGLLGRYLPELADWDRPEAVRVVAALVEGGHVAIPPGVSREQMIAQICQARGEVPGLRQMQMSDGQVFLARTIDLGEAGAACIFTNVTALKEREAARRDLEALFSTAFEAGPSMMVLMDPDQRPLAVNRAFRTRLGYSLEAFAALGWKGILHPDDADSARPATTPPGLPLVRRFVAADGTVLRGQVRFSPVQAGDEATDGRLLVTIEDVTSRWQAEERARFQASLLDQVNNAVLALDRAGRVTYANRAAHALFQWSDKMIPGTPVETLLGPQMAAALAGNSGELETEGLTWGKTRFPAQVAVTPTRDEGSSGIGWVLVVTDLTQRKALDLQLMHSARLATLGEMAASIAHEFNQCLHVIRLSAEAVQMDMEDGPVAPPRLEKRVGNILTQVDRLTEMMGQMRTLSRRDPTGKKPFRAAQALDAVARMVEHAFMADGIRLVRGFAADGPALVDGMRVRLEQVVLNLLNNARDAVQERAAGEGGRGGTVTLSAAEDCLAGRLRIGVRDDGAGIPADIADQIFTPFVTTKDETRGCGLGLSISRSIVREMGGELSFRSLERGTEFVIDLPLAVGAAPDAECAPAQAAPCQPCRGARKRRVLVVDDEALSVMMAGEFLERQGYQVDKAYDGEEALARCQAQPYDVVITDIRMPRMDGKELIRRLEEIQPDTPVIVVTGHLRERHGDIGANVVAVLDKPFQLLDLRQQLTRIEEGAALPGAAMATGGD